MVKYILVRRDTLIRDLVYIPLRFVVCILSLSEFGQELASRRAANFILISLRDDRKRHYNHILGTMLDRLPISVTKATALRTGFSTFVLGGLTRKSV